MTFIFAVGALLLLAVTTGEQFYLRFLCACDSKLKTFFVDCMHSNVQSGGLGRGFDVGLDSYSAGTIYLAIFAKKLG